jgi:hypothetical protein
LGDLREREGENGSEKQTDGQTDRPKDARTDRQTNKQIDRAGTSRGRLRTVDLLTKICCFVKKEKNTVSVRKTADLN